MCRVRAHPPRHDERRQRTGVRTETGMRMTMVAAPERWSDLRPSALQPCPGCGLPMQAKGTRTTVIEDKIGPVATFACEDCEQIVQRPAL